MLLWEEQILNASLIANEVIDSIRKRKERGVLCKLDIKKAYDHINWNFLLGVIQKKGFGWRWVRWITMVHLYCFVLDDGQWKLDGIFLLAPRD